MPPPCAIAIVADFNAQNLANYLAKAAPNTSIAVAPYADMRPVLLQAEHAFWRAAPPTCAIVWTQPAHQSAQFAASMRGEKVALRNVLSDVDSFAAAVQHLAGRVPHVLVPLWCTADQPFILLPQKPGGVAWTVQHMNMHLQERLQDIANVHFLDPQPWLRAAGVDAFSDKLWYLAKVPYAQAVFRAAAQAIAAALRGLQGQARKLIVVDLDHTLWGGLVGEVGWEGLTLGGHHPEGEAYVDFQRTLQSMQRRGILLAIISKNDEKPALEALSQHPEMVLRPADFCAWRINWADKAENLLDLTRQLNLGLQSVVFVDDSPVERARIASALPEVCVVELPCEPLRYRHTLASLHCFETSSISDEDQQRTQMLQAEDARQHLYREIASVAQWLESLAIVVTVRPIAAVDSQRAVQLLNKTNQMNLSGRRLGPSEFAMWVVQPQHSTWTFRVADRFGDAGLVGVASLQARENGLHIVDFVLSCRVFGRGIESAMLHILRKFAYERQAMLWARLLPTPKNGPCAAFFQNAARANRHEPELFCWPPTPSQAPPGLQIAT